MPHFDQILVKISVFGLLYPNRSTDWAEIWHGGGDLVSNFTPIGAPFRPCGVKSLKIGL